MESSRFFVANLPVGTTEKDLEFLFQEYGAIKNIELKSKENLVDPNDIKIIAFVTLNISSADAEYYLNDLNWQKIHGQKIKVSLAKESFLERLKREREEAKTNSKEFQRSEEQPFESQSDLLKVPLENKRKTFDIDAELDDNEVAPELMIMKKRAANSIYNGKIVIQSQDVQPLHVIETKHKKKKQIDSKCSSADQKRKESLNKMKQQYEQNKTAIQQSLQSLGGTSSKKIKFSDAESDQEEQNPEQLAKKSKTNIFGSDEEDNADNLDLSHVPFGKKGEKLVQMQAKQSLDPRFHIDAKFADDDDENEERDLDAIKGITSTDKENGNDLENERQWQMNILEQVVATKLDTVKSADKSQKNKKMLRYDPSKSEHQKFELSREQNTEAKKKPKKTSAVDDDSNSFSPAEVSKEVFYVVTDTLQQSLRTRGEGFSLLNMFSKSDHLEHRDEQLKQLQNEKILVNNKLEKSFTANPFSYDSSSESESEETARDQENATEIDQKNTQNQHKSKKKNKILTESFFIPKNDIRLKEGAKFFIYNKTEKASTENYEEIRNRLKMIIKTKITKTKKNLLNAGYKGKRKI